MNLKSFFDVKSASKHLENYRVQVLGSQLLAAQIIIFTSFHNLFANLTCHLLVPYRACIR